MSNEEKTKVAILTGHYRITGYVNLLPGARLTDFLTDSEEFVALTLAEVWSLEGRKLFSANFMDINRDAVEVVMPVHEITHGLGTADAKP